MKKIIYSCAGEGRGHVTAVIAISQFLIDKLEIVFVAPPSVSSLLREQFPNNKVYDVPGLAFPLTKGRINIPKTIIYSAGILFGRARTVHQMKEIIIKEKIDTVICDFEPYTAYASTELGVPLFHINHPGIVLERVSFRPEILLAKLGAFLIMGSYGQKTAFYSFFNGQLGPIIRKEILELTPEDGNHFLVYLNPHMKKYFLRIAKNFPQYQFKFFPNPQEDYLEALRTCKAVIAPGGHQTISEAIVLKKPILAYPIPSQYEQILNVKMLNYSGRGFGGNPKKLKKSFIEFLNWLPGFPYPQKGHNTFRLHDDTSTAVKEILDFIENH